jgi:HAD superfamily hydrolase (TIGR01509 family)
LLDTFQELLPHYTDDQNWEIIREYRRIYPARGHRLTKVYPGVAEMLERLGGRKSTATTKSSETTRLILTQFGLVRYFDHVQGTDGFPAKPEPDVILRGLEALGARPEECLLVGDAAPDMIAGKRAGVKTCAVTYGYGDQAAMRAAQPDYWIDSPAQLL